MVTACLALAAAGFGVAWTGVSSSAGGDDAPESGPVETILSTATGLQVRPKTVVWTDGAPTASVGSALKWHEIVFLARESKEAPLDFYRAEVRSVGTARLFGLRGLRNLSKSKVGDEYQIAAAPPLVAVATRVLGQIRSVTIYDFAGTTLDETADWSCTARLLGQATNYLETGKSGGLDKHIVRFKRPPLNLAMSYKERTLALEWEDLQGNVSRADIPSTGTVSDPAALAVTTSVQLEKQPVLWLVDTVRGFSWVGPGPIEWAEGRFFALKDFVNRTQYAVFGEDEETAEETGEQTASEPIVLNLPAGLEVGEPSKLDVWPPPPFDPPVYKRRLPGEGTWRPAQPKFVKTHKGAPPAFYRSVTRPDGARPYVKVELFAMDMRQLQLHMVGGHEDPKSTTGSTGTGQIPRRPEILNRLVAAFNGAFKTEHGEYGMIVERDVLLPPKPTSATAASLEDGTTVMGSWPEDFAVPEQLVSLRQNMDPVVENGVVNPRRRYLWGFTLDEDITKMHTIRSGICLSDKGYLVYAWGEDLTAQTLGTAMDVAGCVYGMHLDMNPFHTSFIYYDFEHAEKEGERPKYQAEVALKEMRYSPHRYVNGAPKDFFFLTLRDTGPGPRWRADGIAQPAPAFLPAVFRRETEACTLLAIDRSRVTVRLDHGAVPASLTPVGEAQKETARDAPPVDDLLVAASLGPWSSARGQLINETVVATLGDSRPTAGIDRDGVLSLGAWPLQDDDGTIIGNGVQGYWLSDERASNRRVAVMAANEKWYFVGVGPRTAVQRELNQVGVDQAVAFASAQSESKPVALAIRGEKGMVDPAGETVREQASDVTTIQFVAKPKSLGAKRLETAFGQPLVEMKKQKKK